MAGKGGRCGQNQPLPVAIDQPFGPAGEIFKERRTVGVISHDIVSVLQRDVVGFRG